ncbi:hypothetical protein [Streptomyces sp. NPDC056227]|uniref:hypothetical protein n=1 Tax=Streptomyces sp. NPDC056227 TaxID=3345753 RepID=UPI0035DEFC0C
MTDTRTPDERIADVQRHGHPITPQQRYDAAALLRDLLATAARHGVTLADFDGVVDLPGGCLDAVVARSVPA